MAAGIMDFSMITVPGSIGDEFARAINKKLGGKENGQEVGKDSFSTKDQEIVEQNMRGNLGGGDNSRI
ncbi:MAG TPA: hypothetical protein VG722_04960, partial [Tepidisphaeraceae bacterium]|nr:hypothetical protein [Tepidisphaeraceae bacterium]